MKFDGFDGFIQDDSWVGVGEMVTLEHAILFDNKSKTLRGRWRAGRKAFIKAKGLRKLLAFIRGFRDPDPLVGYFDFVEYGEEDSEGDILIKGSIETWAGEHLTGKTTYEVDRMDQVDNVDEMDGMDND